MEKKVNIPKKGAAKKWSNRLKELGNQEPPQDLVNKINNGANKRKKSAGPRKPQTDLDV